MNDDSQQTVATPTTDNAMAQPPATPSSPMTGEDVAGQAKDIAEHDINNMMPSMPSSDSSASVDPSASPAMSEPAADSGMTTPPADAPTADVDTPAPTVPAENDEPAAEPTDESKAI